MSSCPLLPPPPRLLLKSTPTSIRMLLVQGNQELLRAALPGLRTDRHRFPAPMLCETLSLWLDRQLSVVLTADASEPSYELGLCDAFGFGNTTAYYHVEVIEAEGSRLQPLGSFRDLQRLELRRAR